MPEKVDVSVDKEMNRKEKRKTVPLLQKLDIMNRMDHGCLRTPLICKRMKGLFRLKMEYVGGSLILNYRVRKFRVLIVVNSSSKLLNWLCACGLKIRQLLSLCGDVLRKRKDITYMQSNNVAFRFLFSLITHQGLFNSLI
jgi:hypothetical protein